MSQPRSISPWWALLLLPLGLAGGWLIGNAPEPAVPPAAGALGEAARAALASGEALAMPDAAGGATRAAISQWTTMEAALEESRRTGKPILIDFNAEWCPPCQMLKRQVFDDAALARRVQREVIPVSIVDRRREDGANPPAVDDLQRRFAVDAFPTLVVHSARTGRSEHLRGYGGPQHTVDWITRAAAAVR